MQIMDFMIQIDDLNFGEEEKSKSPQELIADIINVFILSYSQERKGLDESERRKYYKIQDVFDKAIKEGSEVIELEDEYAKFIKTCRSNSKIFPNKLTRRVEFLMDNIKEKE